MVAGLLAVGAGFKADGEEDERKTRGEAGFHHLASCWAADSGDPGRRCRLRLSGRRRRAGGLAGVGAVLFAGGVAFDVGAGDEGLVGVDADDAEAGGVGRMGKVDEFADGSGVGVGLVDGGDVVGVGGGVEDAVGLVADDEGVDACRDRGRWRQSAGSGGLGTRSLVARVAMSRTWMPSGAV